MTTAVRHRTYWSRQNKCMADLPNMHLPKDFQEGPIGPWHLDIVPPMTKKQGKPLIAQRGYWSGFDFEPCFWRLTKDDEVWMTTSRMERESHAVHLKHATGVVMVCGVGLGMFLYNVCRKPDVKRVIAVDIDEDLLMWCQLRARRWRDGGKIEFMHGDAMDLNRTMLSKDFGIQEPINYLYVDIWPDMDSDRAVDDVHQIQTSLMPRVTSWWTQELHFIHWCATSGVSRDGIGLDLFDRWCIEMDLVMPERSTAYLRYCIAVARNTALR